MTIGVVRTGNSTGLGTGTTKTELSPAAGLFMPSDSKALLAVKTSFAEITPTVNESVGARLDIESPDVRNMSPYEVLFAPQGAARVAGSGANFTGQETYQINALLGGGEALHVYGTALVANTVAPEAIAWLVVSNNPMDIIHPLTRQPMPQLHAKLGTFTVSGTTTDTDVAGTKYSFSGGRSIVELFGYFHPKTVVAGDAVVGEIKYTSSEFIDSIPQTLPLYALSMGLASGAMLIPGISRQKVDIPVKPGQVNIQDYLNCGILPATQGSFIDGVMYV